MHEKRAATVLELCTVVAVLLLALCSSVIADALSAAYGIDPSDIVLAPGIQGLVFICSALWCVVLIALTFRPQDVLLCGVLGIAAFAYARCGATARGSASALILMFGVAVGKWVRLRITKRQKYYLLLCLIIMLALSSVCHVYIQVGPYHGPRWTGLLNNPNIYGELMAVCVVLGLGILLGERKSEMCYWVHRETRLNEGRNGAPKDRNVALFDCQIARAASVSMILAAGVAGIGLLMSFSRGSWLGTAAGSLYLARVYRRLKWRFIGVITCLVVAVVWLCWNETPNTSSWYVKRLDFGRPSAQHRIAAWRAGFAMMRDYPLGVGWNKTIETYKQKYYPPENGASAIMTNDYIMLGTQLGLAALLCFVGYVVLCLRGAMRGWCRPTAERRPERQEEIESGAIEQTGATSVHAHGCRAGVVAMLITFWFDGGLFVLPTALLFWILLELGSAEGNEKEK